MTLGVANSVSDLAVQRFAPRFERVATRSFSTVPADAISAYASINLPVGQRDQS